jgi:hypothetical protein
MRLTYWLASSMVLIALACNKDEDSSTNCEKLVGKWEATSWMEDDEQFFGDTIFIISSALEFKTMVENQGDVDWRINYTLGGPQDVFGNYAVNTSCDEVTITPKSGTPTTYSFTIDGNTLTLETHAFNVHVVQEYVRSE